MLLDLMTEEVAARHSITSGERVLYKECVKEAMNVAISNGYLEAVKFVYESSNSFLDVNSMVRRAASNGHIDIIDFFRNASKLRGFFDTEDEVYKKAAKAAAENGHIHVIDFFHREGKIKNDNKYVMAAYASKGDLEHIKTMYEADNTISAKLSMQFACKKGHLPVVQFLCEQKPNIDKQAIRLAAQEGYLHIIQGLHGIGKLDVEGYRTAWVNAASVEISYYLLSLGTIPIFESDYNEDNIQKNFITSWRQNNRSIMAAFAYVQLCSTQKETICLDLLSTVWAYFATYEILDEESEDASDDSADLWA